MGLYGILKILYRKAGAMNMGREYKLDDSLIFKPVKQQLTPEEELQAKKDLELFFDMLEKNGIASLTNPSEEISREQMYADIRSGKIFVGDYNDATGKATANDYYRHLRGENRDKT